MTFGGSGSYYNARTGEWVNQSGGTVLYLNSECKSFKVEITQETKLDSSLRSGGFIKVEGLSVYRVVGRVHENTITATEIIKE